MFFCFHLSTLVTKLYAKWKSWLVWIHHVHLPSSSSLTLRQCVCVKHRERGISQPACASLHERISVLVNVPNESSYYCWEPAGSLQWQPVISAPHALKIPSRWHPFVPLPSPPFSSHQLCSTYSKMSLLLIRQSCVLPLQLHVAVRKISGRRRGVVLFWLFWTPAWRTLV